MPAESLDAAPSESDPFETGPFETGMSAEVFLDTPDRVLKLYRAPSEPEAIENELRATALAHALGLPVARPFGLVERDGRSGILFERLSGATMVARYGRDPVGFLIGLRRLARIQHAIHAHRGPDLPAQQARIAAEIGWARVPEAVRRAALRALERLPAGDRLCHGDIHPGNALCAGRSLCIIDWQKASAGNPAGDASRSALMIRHGRIGHGGNRLLGRFRGLAAEWYLRCYRAASGLSAQEIAAWDLPLLVARMCGRHTDMDAEVMAAIAELMAREGA